MRYVLCQETFTNGRFTSIDVDLTYAELREMIEDQYDFMKPGDKAYWFLGEYRLPRLNLRYNSLYTFEEFFTKIEAQGIDPLPTMYYGGYELVRRESDENENL